MNLYEVLASDLGSAIASGALRAGDRLPSVRQLATERRVSVATAVSAYAQLESAGLIETRPKSGHFVRRRLGEQLLEPRASRPVATSVRPSVSTGVARLFASLSDRSIIPLGSAYIDPALLPIAALNRTLASIAREVRFAGGMYDASPGPLALRRQLARRAVTWGLALHEDDFVTTVGATEALQLCLRAVAKPGDTIAVESPCYFGILQAIEGLGMTAVEIPARPRTGMDLDALEDVLNASREKRVRAVVAMPNVSNPLGSVMPDDAKERLVRLLARHDVPLIEDDIYGDLVFDGTRPRPVRAWDREGRVLLCGSTSKTLAPGYRVGWVVPGRYYDDVVRLQHSSTLAGPTLPQLAVAEFLASGGYDRHLRRLRARLAGGVERFRDAIGACFPEGTRVTSPLGGFVLWIELPPGVDGLELQARALEHKVSVAPGAIFSARARYSNFIRLSCASWSPAIEAALTRIGQLARR
jgi:DNA-binding transcriptional MocR family regulator